VNPKHPLRKVYPKPAAVVVPEPAPPVIPKVSVNSQTAKQREPRSLADAVRRRRGSLSIRKAAKEIGIAHANLQDMEKGGLPRVPVFIDVLVWLEVIDEPMATKLRRYAQ
jgi:hypothetical protein